MRSSLRSVAIHDPLPKIIAPPLSPKRKAQRRGEIGLFLVGGGALLTSALISSSEFLVAAAIATMGLTLISVALNDTGRILLMMILVSLPLLNFSLPTDTRFGVVIPLAVIALDKARHRPRSIDFAIPAFLATAAIIAFLSSLWAVNPGEARTGALSLAILAVATAIIPLGTSYRSLVNAGVIWSATLTVLGLSSYALGVDSAIRGDRVQGVFGNANGAGIAALLLVAFCILGGQRYLWWAIPLATVTVVLSESRASGLAMLVMLLIIATYRARRTIGALGAFIVIATLVSTIAVVAAPLFVGSANGILRTDNSREEVWGDLIEDFQRNPWVGQGWSNQSGGAESLFLLLSAQLGVIGIALIAITVYLVVSRLRLLGVSGLAVAMAVLINSAFEGWLMTGGSAFAWAVWIMVAGAQSSRSVSQNSKRLGTIRRE